MPLKAFCTFSAVLPVAAIMSDSACTMLCANSAAAAITALTTQAINSFAEYEQLAGGAGKIFDEMSQTQILEDAQNAYWELGLSANQYLAIMNDVGATFAATMGDQKGYETAQIGLQAISDYASGTGKNVDVLSDKFVMITRSASSYQSIADQFSGILPATSAAFLEQAQAAGFLGEQYKSLTEVPIDEYQEAVSLMLQQGVSDLGLANNTAAEALTTISGSLAMTKAAWSNLVTGLADDSADLDMLIGNFVESVGAVATNLIPKIGTALNGASKLVRDLIPVIVQEIPVLIEENLPVLAESAVSIIQSLVDGISENQEMLMETAFETITFLAESFIEMLPQIVQLGLDLIVSLANGVSENLPLIASSISAIVGEIINTIVSSLPGIFNVGLNLLGQLASGIESGLPDMVARLPQIIEEFLGFITAQLPSILEQGTQILNSLLDGIINAIPVLVAALPQIISSFVEFITSNLPLVINSGISILKNLISGIIGAIPSLIAALPQIISAIVSGIGSLMGSIVSIGTNIIAGIKSGIANAWNNLVSWFKGLFGDLIGIAKRILGIASPSKVFKKIGGFTAEGFGEGFEDEFSKVKGDMEDALNFDDASVGINASIRKVGAGAAGGAFGGTSIGNITINIDGANYDDEETLAMVIAEKIQNMTDRRSAVYA